MRRAHYLWVRWVMLCARLAVAAGPRWLARGMVRSAAHEVELYGARWGR